jgi:hypothetical protein
MTKLFSVTTRSGFCIFDDATTPLMEEKLVLTLNDLIEFDSMPVDFTLNRKIQLKLPEGIQKKLYSSRDKNSYYVTVTRKQ